MPHKNVPKEIIESLQAEIKTSDISISRIKTISRGGSEAIKELVAQVSDFLMSAKEKKDQCLDMTMGTDRGTLLDAEIQARSALICRGQEKAFEIVLKMIENPEEALVFYMAQKDRAEKDLEQYRKIQKESVQNSDF